MKRIPAGSKLLQDDNLVKIWLTPSATFLTQGKRVAKTCSATQEERRAYVAARGSIIALVKAIKFGRNISLSDAVAIAREARGVDTVYSRYA